MADCTAPCSPSAASTGRASSLLNRRKTDGDTALWIFDRARKGEVLMERGAEANEVDADPAARKAARRMRCLGFD
jgi:hypothetical protein